MLTKTLDTSAHTAQKLPRRRALWLYAGLLLLLAIIFAASNWPAIMTVNLELGDFAANSLLIQDAKSLSLVHGNYSRVGFNHPGPAILYVLMLGEVVFHDWLHVAPSPFSGQLLAVALYNAAWLVAIFAIVRRSVRSTAGVALFTAALVLALGFADSNIFAGIWFPHLYVLPFATVVLAASRLVYGKLDSLIALGVSTGFLLNGHVSFVAIVGIVMICVLAANYVIARRSETPRVLAPSFLRAERSAALRLVGIVLLFLVPLAIACMIDPQSPVRLYLAFSKGNHHNSLRQAVHYVGGYWEGALGAVCVTALLAALVLLVRSVRSVREFGAGLLVAMAGGSLALLYYAKVGIDMLDYKYIGLFYYAVPAFAAALAVLCAYATLRRLPARNVTAVILAGIALVMAFKEIRRSPVYMEQFNQPVVAEWYDALRAVESPGRLVLDLDNAVDWGFVWRNILGVEIYGKRRHTDLFCVNQNWHISFTRAAVCTEQELATSTRLFVRPSAASDSVLGKPIIDRGGLSVYRVAKPELPVGVPFKVGEQVIAYNNYILKSGWSTIEPKEGFIWSLDNTARLDLHIKHDSATRLLLDLEGFIPKPDYVQEAQIEMDGKPLVSVRFTQQDNRKQVSVPLGPRNSDDVTVTLRFSHPISPQQAGVSSDPRVLGVRLYGITLEGN
jgi:hypothetical protein